MSTILRQVSIRAMLNCAGHYFNHRVHGTPLPSNLRLPSLSSSSSSVAISNSTPAIATPVFKSDLDNVSDSIETRVKRIEVELVELRTLVQQLVGTSTPNSPESTRSPLWDYWQTQKQTLAIEYQRPQIITDSDDLGKLTTIATAFQPIFSFEIDYLNLSRRRLPEHLLLIGQRKIAVGFLQIDGAAFTHRIRNWNEVLTSDRSIYYQLWRDQRLRNITGRVGHDEIERLNHSNHGIFLSMDAEHRRDFELLYRLIIDIQNRDLELPLDEALNLALVDLSESWVCQLLQTL